MKVFVILALLIAISIVLFASQNAAIVTISFLSFHYDGSLALILVVVFALGLISGILVSVPSLVRKSSVLRDHRRRIRELEESMARCTNTHTARQDEPDKQ
ncbi:MAG: LapA family protein [Thermodesulfovibrionales bacterium]|jgi:putative membrane protein